MPTSRNPPRYSRKHQSSARLLRTVLLLAKSPVGHQMVHAATPSCGDIYNVSVSVNRQGWTALHFAAGSGQVAICTSLLAAGADVQALDSYGDRAVDKAMRNELERYPCLPPGMHVNATASPPCRTPSRPIRPTHRAVRAIADGFLSGTIGGQRTERRARHLGRQSPLSRHIPASTRTRS